jgi:very-short-patch-repair endonuclease
MKDIDVAIANHFARHHGVIGRDGVLRLGGSEDLIEARLRSGEWIRRYKNAYVLAAAPRSPAQDLTAALVTVPGAVASHLSAAWLLGLVGDPPRCPQLTVVGRNRARPTGVVVHRTSTAPPSLQIAGFACTTATRTLVDLAAVTRTEVLTAALDQALLRHLTSIPRLERALRTTDRGRRGSRALREQLEARGMTAAPEPSVLESHMDRLLHRSGLPAPVPQYQTAEGRYRLDYAWPDVRLAVEVKGYAWHSSPESLAADTLRERHLGRIDWTILSFTWTDVTRRPSQVAAEIAAAYQRMASRSATG